VAEGIGVRYVALSNSERPFPKLLDLKVAQFLDDRPTGKLAARLADRMACMAADWAT